MFRNASSQLNVLLSIYFLCLLLGRKGAMIQKLRDEYSVNIRVPKATNSTNDEEANQIHLTGYEEKCIKAKEAIEAIIKEMVS